MKNIIKEVFTPSIIVFLAAGFFGYISINNGGFEEFSVFVLSVILAKQFERDKR